MATNLQAKLDESNSKKGRSAVKKVEDACKRKAKHEKVLQQCNGRCGIAPTDPDCGIMHAKEDGYKGWPTPNYNVQIATQDGLVTNYGVYDAPCDKETAIDFITKCMSENGTAPSAIVADAGYGCEETYVKLDELGIEAALKYPGYDSQSKSNKHDANAYNPNDFKVGDTDDTVTCPAGHLMKVVSQKQVENKNGFISVESTLTCDKCDGCPFHDKCAAGRKEDHLITRKLNSMRELQKAKKRLDTPINQQRLQRRSLEPEPVFGNLKHNKNYRTFRHFGNAKVTMDLGLVFMAMNINKLYRRKRKCA